MSSLKARVIPRLDVKAGNLVKGIHLEGLRVLGKPESFARAYYEQGADELLFMDVVASLYGRNNILAIIERTADQIFIPLLVGGGIRSVADVRDVLRAGADKVMINTAATQRPEFITEASQEFGASTVVVSIEAIKRGDVYEAYTDGGRERTGRAVVDWAVEAAGRGAGEILITSVDRDGTGNGYELELTRLVAAAVPVPVIASGGAGSAEDCAAVLDSGASAVGAASVLHYGLLRDGRVDRAGIAPEINLAHLDRPGFTRVRGTSLAEIKSALAARGYYSRDVAA